MGPVEPTPFGSADKGTITYGTPGHDPIFGPSRMNESNAAPRLLDIIQNGCISRLFFCPGYSMRDRRHTGRSISHLTTSP